MFQRFYPQASDGVCPARLQPWIIASNEFCHRLFLVFDLDAHQPLRDLGSFCQGDLAIEQRHQHVSQVRFQDVIEEFQRIVVHGDAGGLETNIGTVQIEVRMQEVQQTKDALQFLLHGLLQRSRERIDAVCRGADGSQNLV